MTDLATPDTTSTTEDEQRRRVEQLQRRRAARAVPGPPAAAATGIATPKAPTPRTTGRRSRPHPAIRARIGAAGLGLVTLFGLVATMGLAQRSSATGVPAPAVTAPAEVVVVIHRASSAPAGAAPSITAAAPASAPIALTARPTVQAAAPSRSTPTAKTNGSR